MIPQTLTLRNFLSYRGSVTIDFSELSIACLSGENGAGKSALLDAMTWAVWGKSRAATDTQLISLGAEEMEVTFCFRMGAREYRVMRRRTKTRPTLEFDTRAVGSDNWLPISGDSVRDTSARIVEELRLDHETFVNSAFLQQGQADRFTQNRPGERKRILGEILDLAAYDRLATEARDEVRRARDKMDRLQDRLGRIELTLGDRHEIEVQVAETDEQISASDQQLSRLRAEIDALQAKINAAEQTEGMVERAAVRLQRITDQLTETSRRRAEASAEMQKLEAILAREAQIRSAAEELRTWRKVADDCAALLTRRQPLLERIGKLDAQIQQKTAEQNQRAAVMRQSVGALEARVAEVEARSPALERCEAEIARLEARTATLPAKTAELNARQDRLSELDGENRSLRARMQDIQERIASLKAGDATCPVCRRPLEDGEHAHIHAEWTEDGTRLGDAFRANREQITALKQEIEERRRELDELAGASRNLAAAQAQAKDLREQLARLPELATQLEREQAELKGVDALLASLDFVKDERAELAHLREELGGIEYDEDQHTKATAILKQLDGAEADLAALERATADMRALTERAADLGTQIKTLSDDKAEVETELKELRTSLEGIDAVRKLHGEKSAEQRMAAEQHRKLEQQRGALRRRLAELDELAEEKQSLEKETAAHTLTIDAYRELTVAFGRDGVQAMIIENVLPELEEEANRLLQRMTNKHLQIQFRTTREAVSSDSIIETLDIIIADEDGQRPYQMFSGGEAFRIDFAIRVALSKLLARRAGASVDTLIIDEGFGTQDQQGRAGLIEALQSVSDDFDLILAITHIDELRDQFPNRIEVVKTDEGSRATVI